MGSQKHPFDTLVTKVATAGENDVEQTPVEYGYLYCIQRVVVENEDSGAADVRILKSGGGADLMLAEEDQVQAGTLYWLSDDFYLHEGQGIKARFTGCTAGDQLRMVLTGWYRQVEC